MRASRRKEQPVLLLNVDSHRRMWSLPQGAQDAIAERFPRVQVVRASDPQSFRAALPQAEILYTWQLPRELFAQAKRLKWIHTPAAGVDHLLHPQLRHSDILLTNCRGVAGDVMADHIFALMLALTRRLPDSVRLQAQQRWGQSFFWSTEPVPFSLSGKVMGIIGLGGVGVELAKRARAFGMTVIALRRRSTKAPKSVSKVLKPDQLPELLAESDVVVLAVPLTPETRALMGSKEFRLMKPGAYFINVGRGEQVNEGALIKALREKSIAGAALDVFQREPLPKNSVLWRVPGLLITPHYAGTYPEHMVRATELFVQNLALYLAGKGKKLRNLVDKQTGY
jgi:phosphoglycerate dehydrogenase-like enzyme